MDDHSVLNMHSTRTILIFEDNDERIAVSKRVVFPCAIVGGIVALSAGRESIPSEWLKAREPIQILWTLSPMRESD